MASDFKGLKGPEATCILTTEAKAELVLITEFDHEDTTNGGVPLIIY